MDSAVSWHHSVEQKLYLKQRLTTLQRNAALSITRGLKSSPTENLEILAGLQPIHLKLKETAIKAALRLKRNNTWISNHCLDRTKASKSHAYHIDKTLANIPFSKCQLTTLSDIIITDYILTDTCFHGHNYSRSAVSGKFFIFRTVKTNFHLNE